MLYINAPQTGGVFEFISREEQESDGMRMGEIEIQDYARQFFEAHGDKAVVEAAQKACAFEKEGKDEEAQTWRHIEAALMLMRGPRVS
ncbi:MAG: hypothetical protein P4L40_14775 [Terracidiphilus sp.]|nr:hypothetical protein [Terracidiphilus sp.]